MSDGILLRGLDGSNPLAFLAALGTLRTLSIALPDEKVRMVWEQAEGAWRPRVFCSLASDAKDFVAEIDGAMRCEWGSQAFTIGDNLNLPARDFRKHLIEAIRGLDGLSTAANRVACDYLAAFGSEAICDEKGVMTDTALRTMSGAGHQHFLKFCRDIIRNTEADHIRRTLLANWDYADDGRGLNLRFDPADDRRYALRWDDPSGDPSKTMRGANRLAIEAIPLLPTMPVESGLATVGFTGRGARDTMLVWPIWTSPIVVDVVRSVLGQTSQLQGEAELARQVGIAIIFRSARITIGKFRSFTPGMPVCEGISIKGRK